MVASALLAILSIREGVMDIAGDQSSECQEYTGPLSSEGYGLVYIGNRKRAYAHRLAYAMGHGIDPAGLQVCHTCDNRRCVNPEHLFLGSMKENQEDKVRKGRQQRGEGHWNQRLTEKDVESIRAMLRDGMGPTGISRQFNVHPQTIGDIKAGRTWRPRKS